jgi:NADH-dependent peroxiredoxin subunit F
MLDDVVTAALKGYLGRIDQPVELIASLDGSEASKELAALLAEVAAHSSQLKYSSDGTDDRRPSFALGRAGEAARVRFAGLPLGHEFTSFVLALLQAGGVAPRADAALLDDARAIDRDLSFETYVSLGCQICPPLVQALNALAAVNPRIRHCTIDGALFAAEVEAQGILSVPTVLLNGTPFAQGRLSLAEILAKLDPGAARARERTAIGRPGFDLLVVGSGPAGAAAAIYAARKGIRTGIASERFGGQLKDTLGIENFISLPATEGPALALALEGHVRSYGVEVVDGVQAVALEPGAPSTVRLNDGTTLSARSVVLATGARWRELGVPGERAYRNRGVAYCPHCDGPLFKGRDVAVVGGGNSGVEAAIDLAGVAAQVTLIEYDAKLRADAVLADRLAQLPNVTVITGARTTAVLGDGQRVSALRYVDRASGAVHELALSGVFVQIGLVPNTDWLKDTVALNPRGEIEVGERGETSVAGVYAAGDCTSSPYKQIVIAMGDGAKAALGAFEHLLRAPLAAAAQAPSQDPQL